MCPKKRYILRTGHPTLSPDKSTYYVSQLIEQKCLLVTPHCPPTSLPTMCPKKRYILPTGHPTLSPGKSTYYVSTLIRPKMPTDHPTQSPDKSTYSWPNLLDKKCQLVTPHYTPTSLPTKCPKKRYFLTLSTHPRTHPPHTTMHKKYKRLLIAPYYPPTSLPTMCPSLSDHTPPCTQNIEDF